MKGYKTAYTPHEVKTKEEAAERRGIKMAVETIYTRKNSSTTVRSSTPSAKTTDGK